MQQVLKRVLAARFHLQYHTEGRPLLGYIVTVADGGLKVTDAGLPNRRERMPWRDGQVGSSSVQYHLHLRDDGAIHRTRDQDFPHPIFDHTGLTKPYDFSLKLSLGPDVHTRDDRAPSSPRPSPGSLAFRSRARGGCAAALLVVDTVDRTPTANSPDIATLLPVLPDLEFAGRHDQTVRGQEPQDTIRPAGSQITFRGFNMQGLQTRAFELPTGLMLGDALPKLPQTRYTIVVKLPPDIDARAVNQDPDQIDNMLQKLLIDRFKLKYHWGQWTQPDAYVFAFAGAPKMKKADP